jgi:hypothetical protein
VPLPPVKLPPVQLPYLLTVQLTTDSITEIVVSFTRAQSRSRHLRSNLESPVRLKAEIGFRRFWMLAFEFRFPVLKTGNLITGTKADSEI